MRTECDIPLERKGEKERKRERERERERERGNELNSLLTKSTRKESLMER